jgi:peptidyl-prolyl cis-trans isomerase B (cyclophilin B)
MRLPRMWQIWAFAATATAVSGIGCGKSGPAIAGKEERGSPTLSIPAAGAPPAVTTKLDRPFAEAAVENNPGNQQPPVDTTIAGRSTGTLRVEVQKLWDTIRFTTPSGKPIGYIAHFDTEFGKFDVQLLPEVAPNHVRNFVALAKAGYYNGLVFEHVFQTPTDDATSSMLELVEGGCPLGTGEPGVGHLGYWLRPEFSDTIKHEPGTFGAYHDDNADSAACRFYITLTNAPVMDGAFTAYGNVVAGLDVIRTISKRTRIDVGRPVKPAEIRSVTIETQEVR